MLIDDVTKLENDLTHLVKDFSRKYGFVPVLQVENGDYLENNRLVKGARVLIRELTR